MKTLMIALVALLGGAYLVGRRAWLFPVGAVFVSDLVIGFYHPLVMVAVYGSFYTDYQFRTGSDCSLSSGLGESVILKTFGHGT